MPSNCKSFGIVIKGILDLTDFLIYLPRKESHAHSVTRLLVAAKPDTGFILPSSLPLETPFSFYCFSSSSANSSFFRRFWFKFKWVCFWCNIEWIWWFRLVVKKVVFLLKMNGVDQSWQLGAAHPASSIKTVSVVFVIN